MTTPRAPSRPVAANTRPAPPPRAAGPALAPLAKLDPRTPPAVTRALTIAEPWAWLIVSDFVTPGRCVKPVENRSWPTSQRGPIAVHASSKWNDILDEELGQDLCDMHPAIASRMTGPANLIGSDPTDRAAFNLIFHPGCIVGVVEIIDCLAFDPETDDFRQVCHAAGHGAWYDAHEIEPAEFANGPFCFLLSSPRQLTQPIPCKGALNFWYLDKQAGLAAAVAAALRRPYGEPHAYRAALHAAGKPAPMPNAGSFAKPRKKPQAAPVAAK